MGPLTTADETCSAAANGGDGGVSAALADFHSYPKDSLRKPLFLVPKAVKKYTSSVPKKEIPKEEEKDEELFKLLTSLEASFEPQLSEYPFPEAKSISDPSELFPATPSVYVSSTKDAFSPQLLQFCLKKPIVLIR